MMVHGQTPSRRSAGDTDRRGRGLCGGGVPPTSGRGVVGGSHAAVRARALRAVPADTAGRGVGLSGGTGAAPLASVSLSTWGRR